MTRGVGPAAPAPEDLLPYRCGTCGEVVETVDELREHEEHSDPEDFTRVPEDPHPEPYEDRRR